MLFRFGKIDSTLCSFCKMIEETLSHLFYNCIKKKLLWDQSKDFISNETWSFPSLTPQSAIVGHIDLSHDYLLMNHIILIYKFYIYHSRNRGYLKIEQLKAIIDKTRFLSGFFFPSSSSLLFKIFNFTLYTPRRLNISYCF